MGIHYSRLNAVEKPIKVALVGCGGTGSVMLHQLARIQLALLELGHPGMSVTAYDDDTVSKANIGRQTFSECDVGLYKVNVLMQRINAYYGFRWIATPIKAERGDVFHDDVVITCVDSVDARISLADKRRGYFLDCGNSRTTGQVILGAKFTTGLEGEYHILPNVVDLFPDIRDHEDPDEPSCSLAEALRKQDLFINSMIANAASQLLWDLLRHSTIKRHGCFINLESGSMTSLPIDPETWERFGYQA